MESATVRRAPLMIIALIAWALMALNASAGVAEADLSMTIDDGLTEVDSGDDVTYTIVAANAGPEDVTGASLSNSLSAGLSCAWTCSASAGSSCTANGSGEIADTVDILSGGSLTYTASCNVTAPGGDTITNSVTIAEPAGITDPDVDNNTAADSTSVTSPVVEADLSVTVSDGLTEVTSGDDVTYTIVAGNAGPNDVTAATLSNSLSAGLACTWTCSASADSSCTASGSDEISDSVDILSGGTVTYTATCNVSAAGGSSITNMATIAAPVGITDNVAGNNSATDSTSVTATLPAAPIPTLGLWSLIVLSLGLLGIGLLRQPIRARVA